MTVSELRWGAWPMNARIGSVVRSALMLLLLCLASSVALASLEGHVIRAQYYHPNLSSPMSPAVDAVVGPGVEVTNFHAGDPRINIDYSATNIRITYNSAASWTVASFNGPVFTDLNGTIPDILGVAINGETNMVGLDASRISFDADTIRVNWNNLPFTASTVVSLDVVFTQGAVHSVPTLSQWSMILLALFMVMGTAAGLRNRER